MDYYQPIIEFIVNLAVSFGLLTRNKTGIIQAIRSDVMTQIQPALSELKSQVESQGKIHENDMQHLKEKMDAVMYSLQEKGQDYAEDILLVKNSLNLMVVGQTEIIDRLKKLELSHH